MYCSQCGRDVPAGTAACPYCGAAMAVSATPATPPAPMPSARTVPQRTSGLAVASLVTGILGIVPGMCFGLLGLIAGAPALILGILALREIKEKADVGGQGMAIAGIVMGGVSLAWALLSLFAIAGLGLLGPRIEEIFGSIYNSLNY